MKTFTNLIKCASLSTFNKKRYYLFIIMLLTLGVTNAWADDVTFSWAGSATADGGKTDYVVEQAPVTLTFALGTASNAPRTNKEGSVRMYANTTLTISCASGNITKVTFTPTSDSYNAKNLQYNGTALTSDEWTLSSPSNEVTLTASANARFKTIVVTYTSAGSGDEPPTPTTQYTVKWYTALGTSTDVTLDEGAAITKPATDPTMSGYEFMGWTDQCSVAEDGTGFTALTDFGTADADKEFYAVFAVATTTGGGGSTTGSKTLVSSSSSTYYQFGYITGVSGTNSASWTADGFTMVQNKNSSSSAVALNYAEIRVYASHSLVFTPSTGSTITSIVATATTDAYATALGGSSIENCTKSVSDNVVTITPTDGTEAITITNSAQSRLKTIVVNYTTSGGGTTTYNNYITTCASDIEYVELGDDFKWSAAEAEVTIDATDNVFPELTNTHNVPVKYSSSDDAIATIAADGTVTLKKEGTVTITAKYEGGTSAGTGKEYKAKTVTYSLKVNKAVAQPTGTMYVKVTDAVTDGEYLIVYEAGNVAFNGALPALDAVSNTIAVEINSNTIAGNTEIDAATFTIASMTGGHSIQSKNGTYIGRTASGNGMNTGSSAILNIISITGGAVKVAGSGSGASASLQYYAQSGSERFRYYTSAQKAIALYKKVDPNAVVEPVFTLAAGEYYGTQSVEITCATAGAEIYYTLNGTDPTSASTKYTGAISIASTTTVKAIAVKGANSSTVVSATYTILAPLATMQEIFDKATVVGGTATPVHITMNNWVVTGVKNSNAYVTDGTKGLIIYKSSHGFVVGDVLSGTVACNVQLYKGSAELTELTATTEGLTITTGGAVSPIEVTDITTLGGVNTGSVIKVTGSCTVNGTKYYVAGLELYNSLFAYTNPEAGFNYECTGVYVQSDATQEILPRKAEDLVKIETQQPAGIVFAVTEHTAEVGATDFEEPELTNPNGLTVTYSTSDATLATVNTNTGAVTIGNKTGKVTITASFAGNEDYVAATASYNITISDPNQLEATFVAGTDKSDTKSISKNGITVEFADGSFSRDDNYRCYAGKSMTISYADGNITKIVIECTANDGAEYGPGQFTTETATYSYSGKVGTWTGEANSVTFTNIKQVRMTAITVYYKQDNRADAGLAWNPATISLTVGDAFTPPTFSKPNSVSVTDMEFTSSNPELATVTNAGVISLVSGKTGTATITATFAGDATYKAAEVTCTIIVNHKSEDVVILAKCKDQYYAMVAEYVEGKTDVLQALPVEYVNGKIYNIETEEQKASIIWKRVVVDSKTTFKNGANYLSAVNSAALKLATETCDWVFEGDMYKIEGSTRTILYYTSTGGFKNYATTNMSKDGVNGEYSSAAITVAPVFADGDAYHRTTTPNKFGTICLPFGSSNYTGAQFFECVGKEEGKVYIASVNTLVAGTPYIFLASATEVAVYGDGTTAATAGDSNGLHGTFIDATEVAVGNYILLNNEFCQAEAICYVNANRAYLVMSEVPGEFTRMPGRRYIGMSTKGENAATSLDNITNGENTTIKVIENGQLIIIRNGEKFNAQGQRL